MMHSTLSTSCHQTFDFWMMEFTFRKQHQLDAFILSEISQRVMRRVYFGGNIDGLHHLAKRFYYQRSKHIRLAARRPFMKNSLFATETLELNFSETLNGRNIQKFLSLLASRSILHLKLHYFTKPNSWRKKIVLRAWKSHFAIIHPKKDSFRHLSNVRKVALAFDLNKVLGTKVLNQARAFTFKWFSSRFHAVLPVSPQVASKID